MTITFEIHYNTSWGEQIAVVGNLPDLGSHQIEQALVLNYQEGGYWTGSIQVQEIPESLEYYYVLVTENGTLIQQEWGSPRSIHKADLSGGSCLKMDTWRSVQHAENALYTSAFSDVIFKSSPCTSSVGLSEAVPFNYTILKFQIRLPRIFANQQVAILGNIPELGNWHPKKVVLLENSNDPIWSVAIAVPLNKTIRYKYCIVNKEDGSFIEFEGGDNRAVPLVYQYDRIFITDEYFRHSSGQWKGTGVAMPVFSLRSEQSFGVGEFTDIALLVDWAKKVGMKMVQILPVNDTCATQTWTDSYPYAAISVFALHPIYLNIQALPKFKTTINQKGFNAKQKKLNALEQVDYEAVLKLKLDYARQLYEVQSERFLKSKAFKTFFKANKHWLVSYALFSYLRDKYKAVNFEKWDTEKTYSKALEKNLTHPDSEAYSDIAFYYFLQFYLDAQLHEAANYARAASIVLKGDIPIGIYRYSADAWVQPELYNMNGQAGAPPDAFAVAGQNWGFPTYNWELMAKNDYQWWKSRFTQLSRYFDAFRIDHILGFFRIWQVPIEQVEGIMGYFNPALPITAKELEERGIPFDYKRFCTPYITDDLLQTLFGSGVAKIKKAYLDYDGATHTYSLKSQYNTQRKIQNALQDTKEETYITKLFSLVSNVLLFEVPESNQTAFHPRIAIKDTHSFQSLPTDIRQRLEVLYHDYFYYRQEDFWKQQGMTKLPAIKAATNMLICGEDLGMIPACVPPVMRTLGILTLEIQRMSKNPATEFLQVIDLPYLSVTSTSTHDMSPIRLWWEEEEADYINRFFHNELQLSGEVPDTLEPYVAETILLQHLNWDNMWAVFPIQDLLAMDGLLRVDEPLKERINIPSIAKHYWRYRLHLRLEELLQAEVFNEKLSLMIKYAGR